LTAGIGAGMGIGNLMQQATSGAMQRQQQGSTSRGAESGNSMPDVMTPSEAASILKVSEEDVLAAINDGSLKAKKLGSAYRISKTSLEEFLNS